MLKPELHVACRQLLGPMPSEWDIWWQNTDGTDRAGKPDQWPPHREGFDPDPKLAKLPIRQLADKLHQSRLRQRKAEAGTEDHAQLTDEVVAVENEYARREMVVPNTPDKMPAKPRLARSR